MEKLKTQLTTLIILLSTIYSNLNAQNWLWAKQIGGSQYDGLGNVSVDVSGNSYWAGSTLSPFCFFQNDTLITNGGNDFFLTKSDANGNEIWTKQFGGTNPLPLGFCTSTTCCEGVGGIAIDLNNNVYITGDFCGTTSFGSNVLTSFGSAFYLAKFDTNGNCLWAKKGDGFGSDGGSGVVVDNVGNIYACGTNSDSATFDGTTIPHGGFIAKYDSSGNVIWVKNKFRFINSGSFSELEPFDIKVYNKHILISGNAINDTIIIDTITTFSPQLGVSSCISAFDTAGTIEWLRIFGGNISGSGSSFSIDNSGNSLIAGGFSGNGYFGKDTLTGNNQSDTYLVKFDINGILIWVQQLQSSIESFAFGSSASINDGSSYITGYFNGSANFGTYSITSSTNRDMFLARYDDNGNCLGVRNFGRSEGQGLTQDVGGNPYVSGIFYNSVLIGSSTFTSHGAEDVFIAKCNVITGIGGFRRTANNELLIYANPTAGKCNITVPDEFLNEQNLTLTIYDITGNVIQQKTLSMAGDKIRLNLEAEAKGVYNVTLTNGVKSYSGKIVFE